MRKCLLILLLVALSMTTAAAQDAPRTPADICAAALPADEPETRTYTQPEAVLEVGVDYRAVFCTEAGPIYVDLFEEYTPVTVNNFVFLAQNGYFNNTTFHRVIQDFMAQGGDPTATGTGGPGYQFEDEFVGFLTFDRAGWLAMANAGQNTNGSQFFITTVPYPSLNFRHTIFGEVLEGQENVAAIKLRDPETAAEPGAALHTVVIIVDPASVVTTYETPEKSTQDDVQAGMDSVQTLLDESVTLDEAGTGTYTVEQVASSAPEHVQQDYADFLARHHFQYRITSRLLNAQCNLADFPFTSLGYSLDAFDSREDAAAALADEFFASLPLQMGFSDTADSENLLYPIFTVETTECDQQAVRAETHWQRGRFIATAEITIPADSDVQPVLDLVLSQFVGARIYEPLLADVLRREIR